MLTLLLQGTSAFLQGVGEWGPGHRDPVFLATLSGVESPHASLSWDGEGRAILA